MPLQYRELAKQALQTDPKLLKQYLENPDLIEKRLLELAKDP